MALLIPSALYLLASLIAVRKLLRKNAILLLAGNAEGKKKKSRLLVGCKISFRRKFLIRNLLANKSRTFVVIMGMDGSEITIDSNEEGLHLSWKNRAE